jgi:1,4-dihydroxy-2-naphthoate octaprenyltransferase
MTGMPAAGRRRPTIAARVWWLGARPRTLGIGAVPVALGAAASGRARLLETAGALVVALGLQVGANYANDYFDGVRGVDTPARLGPPRLVAGGLAPPRAVLGAAVACIAVAAVMGTALALSHGLTLLLAFGVVAAAAALLYTGGPRPYAAITGLADASVFVFFGLVATCGTAALEGRVPAAAWWAATASGLLAVAILAANNLRDLASDAAAGRRTLMVQLGDRRARVYYAALVVGGVLAPVLATLLRALPWTGFLVLLAAPLLLRPLRLAFSATGRALAALLSATALLHLAAGVLLSLALVAAAPT